MNKGMILPGIALLALTLATGCGGLEQLVRADAPGFDVNKPALDNPELGHRVFRGQTDTNVCFTGAPATQTYKGWSDRTLVYDAGGTGKLQADFGSTITLGPTISASRKITVTLKNVQEEKLSGLFFDAQGPCASDDALRARYESAEGVMDAVITKALRADTIDISDNTGASVSLSVKADKVNIGGDASAHGANNSTWKGANLYIAHFVETFKVTLKKAPACSVAVNTGQSCDLTTCSVKLDSIGTDNKYGATLSCQDGTAYPLHGPLGQWAGQPAAAGVSYSLRVSSTDQVGIYKIDFLRWNVESR